jgi:hypothetical protein
VARKATIENLQPFKKGQSGNPKGRPKKLPEIDKLLADVLGEEKDGVTAADAILRKLRAMAAAGNIRAAEILLDRAYGKAKQSVDLTSDGEKIFAPVVTFQAAPDA